MKIRTKTIITVIVLSVFIFAALQSITLLVLQPSFSDLERQDTTAKVAQAIKVLYYKIDNLAVKVSDYAFWDDTCNFIQDENKDYVANNFPDSTFENLNLDLVAIVNNETDLLYWQSYDHDASVKVPTSQEIRQLIVSDYSLWAFQSTEDTISGLIVINNKPMIIATAPVITSQNQGPIRGGLLFGKYVDQPVIEELTRLTDFKVSLNTMMDFQAEDRQIANLLMSRQQVVALKENNENSISGYALLSDVHSEPKVVLEIVQSRNVYQQSLWVGNIFLFAAIAFSFLFGLFMLVLLEREIVKPMTRLAGYVEAISLDTNSPAPTALSHSAEEVTTVTNAVRDSLKRKLEGMNEVSRMVAHDLRNPLSGIRNAAFVLKKRYGQKIGDDEVAMLKIINDCVVYSDKVVQDLLDYSCEMKLDKIKIDARRLVDDALSKFVLPTNVKLVNDVSDKLFVNVDPRRIERVFTNLIGNALDAMPNGGTLRMRSKKVMDRVEIEFSDTGVGMSMLVLEKLWVPFFTTKAKGLGIGLSICKRIVDAHCGKIEVKSVEGKGTSFSVFLPLEK